MFFISFAVLSRPDTEWFGFCLFVHGVQGQLLCIKCTSGPLFVAQIHNFKLVFFFVNHVLDFFRMNVAFYRLGMLRKKYIIF